MKVATNTGMESYIRFAISARPPFISLVCNNGEYPLTSFFLRQVLAFQACQKAIPCDGMESFDLPDSCEHNYTDEGVPKYLLLSHCHRNSCINNASSNSGFLKLFSDDNKRTHHGQKGW